MKRNHKAVISEDGRSIAVTYRGREYAVEPIIISGILAWRATFGATARTRTLWNIWDAVECLDSVVCAVYGEARA